jgi:hypothetical protein
LEYHTEFTSRVLLLIIKADGITHIYKTVAKEDLKMQEDLENAG